MEINENNGLDELIKSSDKLDSIVNNTFDKLKQDEADDKLDIKTLKELAVTLKEAVGIKKSLMNLPDDDDNSTLRVIFDNGDSYAD